MKWLGKGSSGELVRKEIVCTGWVQGVGFRYRAYYAAARYGCTGWVENLDDGSVRMEIQGREEAIEAVLSSVSQGTYVVIEDMRVKNLPLEEETGFHVR